MDAPLPNLPLPVIERELSFDALFDTRLQQLRGLLKKHAGIDWDTWNLESEPLNNFCRHAAYGDIYYVAALNDTFRATLLDFGQGRDLIAQASDWYLTPFDGEEIDDLRRRLRETKKGQGGYTDSWYKRWAFAADPRVADVGVVGDGMGGVKVSILSTEDGGVASDELLAIVDAALNAPTILGDNDHIMVVRAVIRVVDVEAQVWLTSEAPDFETDVAKARFMTAFAASRRLGWDFSADFVICALRTSGIRRVVMVTPAADDYTHAEPNEAVALGTVTLITMNRPKAKA